MKSPPLIEFVVFVENIVLRGHQASCTGQRLYDLLVKAADASS